MSETVERYFWSETPETQAKVAAWIVARDAALERNAEFVKEVGGTEMTYYRNGVRVGRMRFQTRKPPDGWNADGLPIRKSKDGKALYKRFLSLTVPTEESYFINGSEFEKYDFVCHGRVASYPTAQVLVLADDTYRVVVRCVMYSDPTPPKVEGHYSSSAIQHADQFNLPNGWNEWRKWEFLKFIEELNVARGFAP